VVLACLCVTACPAQSGVASESDRIHCVTDISHEFTFYFDGRFGKNYVLPNGVDARNWGTLHKLDLQNVNLLILQSGASPCPYLPEDVEAVRTFMAEGGAVVALGDFASFRNEKQYRLNALVEPFGAVFIDELAKKPLKGYANLDKHEIRSYAPKTIKLPRASDWEVLVKDAGDHVVMARRPVGKGTLVVASRSLCGHNPDASDPINDIWWKPLLREITKHKSVDSNRRLRSQMPENETQRQRLPIEYSDYMKSYADAIYGVYDECFPVIQDVMGVAPSKGMLTKLILLPTGGGGFSSGSSIGLAAWWGGFPEKKYGMVELISHESTHSWVHPFTEPMWNEGIATYVGILVGRKMALQADADATLDRWIKGAKRHDPDMTKYDLANGKGIPHAVAMAKPMWIFEQLRKEKPDIVARYFQVKRKLATPEKIDRYTADDSVAVLSIAMGRDLFSWFQSLGITVQPDKATIRLER
ncbi:MAG: hypothetical protein HQ515_13505, partial [Phycisphaeraceae bacterium]|nr:hypothetical protein [Phycisphaeraceae bacterium]